MLVDLPEDRNPIGSKSVYKVKYKGDGTLDKNKAWLVANGFAQQEGIDYRETITPAATLVTIKLVLALATHFGWNIYQMDGC